jgi:hypothetical protein
MNLHDWISKYSPEISLAFGFLQLLFGPGLISLFKKLTRKPKQLSGPQIVDERPVPISGRSGFLMIRLLLVFVTINTVMILMLVPSMTSKHPWLAYVLPGEFAPGSNYSGYWAFFALVLLCDALTVLAVAISVLLPALLDAHAVHSERIRGRLVDREGVSDGARDAVLGEMRGEMESARFQIFVGRTILIAASVFLVIAFGTVTLSFVRAQPSGTMFAQACSTDVPVCGRPVANSAVARSDVLKFTLDQITRGGLLGAPDLYRWRFSRVDRNPDNVLFAHFVFAFRLLLGLILILALVSLRAPLKVAVTEQQAGLKASALGDTPELTA